MKFFFLLLVVVSCATANKKPVTTEFYDTGVGYKIKAPTPGVWYEVNSGNGAYIFGREPSKDELKTKSTILAQVSPGYVYWERLDDKTVNGFFNIFQETMTKDSKSDRMESIKNEFKRVKFKKSECLYFNQVAKDKSALDNKGHPMKLSNRGYACLHPESPSSWITFGFSQRVPMESEFSDLAVEEKNFQESLQFTKIPQLK